MAILQVAELALSDDALAAYEALERDQSRWPTLDRLEDTLEAIAQAPGSRQSRARRFQDPPCFAVPLATPEGEWVVLWREVDDAESENLAAGDGHVLHLGPLPS